MKPIVSKYGELMTAGKSDLQLDPFVPFIPVLTGHTQTVLGHVWPSRYLDFHFAEHVLRLSDGDELLLEYADNGSPFTVSLYHGLAGDSQSDYIRRTALLARRLGWNIVRVNHRGASAKARAHKTYHSGRGADAAEVLRWARGRFPGSRQVAVGFSMSGCVLLNLLTGRSGDEQPDYAVVVNAPLDLARSSELLTVGFSRVYDLRFYLLLKKIIRERGEGLGPMPFLGRTMDVDELYSSKLNGFKNALDYYNQCSVVEHVDRITTKTFVLSAEDDPFVDARDYRQASWGPGVQLELQRFGGHMGYFAKSRHPEYGHRWLDHYLERVFREIRTRTA